MNPAADLTAASWEVFSRLLDQALDVPPHARAAWLESVAAQHAALIPALRRVLERTGDTPPETWLDTLPRSTDDAAAGSTAELHEGAEVGPYRLQRELGSGGMGTVWLAERSDGSPRRQVALKLLRAGWSAALAQRMARERDILASLEHPRIARLYDAGSDAAGHPYLAMEYVEGEPIDVHCRRGALSVRQRIGLLLQVADALSFAHRRLVVHRDVKPGNILVTPDGQVRLLDFGIAKLMEGDRTSETRLTRFAGRALTPDYASPEQIRGDPIGTTSDVYSLGVVAFELLAGERPYRLKRGSAAEIEEAVITADVPLASQVTRDASVRRALRGDLDAILNQALRKDARLRYASIDAFAQDLERHLQGQPVLVQPDSTAYRLRKFVGRNVPAVAATAAVVLALLVGTSVALWQAREARLQAQNSEQVTKFVLDLVQSTDPDEGSKRGTTTLDMLRRAPQRIREEFSQRPEVEVRLLSVVGQSVLGLGEANEAIVILQSAIDAAERRLPADHRELLQARIRLGEALLTASRNADAEAPLMQGLAGMRALDDVPGMVVALRWVSRLHSQNRRNDAAIDAAREAVQLARTRLPPDRLQPILNAEIELLTALQIARRQGQLDTARRVYELTQALYPDRLVRPKLTSREGYGTALVTEGDAVDGVRLLKSALDDAQNLFGPQDRMLGYFAGRLAGAQLRVGDSHGALESAGLARRTWDAVHGTRLHSDLAFGRMYEGAVLTALQRFDEAASLYGEAADLFVRIQGSGSRVALIARAGQAVAVARSGDPAGAEKILAAPPAKLDSFEEAAVAGRFGLILLLQGRTDEARRVLETSLARMEVFGDRFELASQRGWLAAALTDLGRGEEARTLLAGVLDTYRATQAVPSPAHAEAWEILARAEMAGGNAQRAVDASAQSTRFWQEFAPSSAAAARAFLVQARALRRAGATAAAAESLRRARDGVAVLSLAADRAMLAELSEATR